MIIILFTQKRFLNNMKKEVEVDGEIIQLRKSHVIPLVNLGPKEWRVVYPIKDSKGKMILINLWFGGYGNLLRLITYALIGVAIFLGISEQLAQLQDLATNACNYCRIPEGSLVSGLNITFGQ